MININASIEKIKVLSNGSVFKIPLPDEQLLKDYEKEIGFIFSDDYKLVLKTIGNIFYGTIELLSVTRDRNYYRELKNALEDARKLGLPDNWLPICEDNGNYYCIIPDNKIKFWSTDGKSDEEWVDLATWIQFIWIEENN